MSRFVNGKKRCPHCQLEKSREEFPKAKRIGWCRACKAALAAEWRTLNPNYKATWRRANSTREYLYDRKNQLKREYGITLEEFNRRFRAQKGRCAICNEQSEHTLNVDHDHETGRIRGLLCKACNRGLGMFKDNVALLQRAVHYLEAAA